MHEVQKHLTHHRSWLSRLRGDRQQEILGRPAVGYPQATGRGDGSRRPATPTRSPRWKTTSPWKRSRRAARQRRLCADQGRAPAHSRRRWCRCTRRWTGRIGKEVIESVYKDIGFKPDKPCNRRRGGTRIRGPAAPGSHRGNSLMINKALNHLEELLVTFLIGAATVIIFISVAHRYMSGYEIPGLQDWLLDPRFRVGPGTLHHHVRLDGQVRRRLRRAHRHPRRRRRADQPSRRQRCVGKFIIFGLLAGATFTGIVATLGANFVWENGAHYAIFNFFGHGHRRQTFTKGRRRPTSNGRPGSSTARFRSAPR
jgi:hypothetical protein